MGKKLVCIDDSPYLLKQLTTFLKHEMNLNIIATGSDGEEGVSLYRKHLPDLITLDISMPNKSGIEATRDIIAEFPQANILIVTAVHGEQVQDCIDYGAKAFLNKPLKFDDPSYVDAFKKTVLSLL